MINFTKFGLKEINKNLGRNIFWKSYLFTSKGRDTKINDKIDLKEEFQEMLKETKISEDELLKKKVQETQKRKEEMAKAKEEWDKKNESLRKEWEQKRDTNQNENEEDFKINKFANKMKDALNSKNNEQKESNEENENKDKNKTDKKEKKNKSENTKENGPTVISKFFSGFARVWKQTFPGEENLELLLEKRKMEAQILKSKIKEATEEEIAEIEASIPEWKRGALVLVESEVPQEKLSIFEVAKRNLAFHLKSLKIYQEAQKSLKDSEVALLMEDFKKSYSNVKENIKESQNPLFVVSRDIIDRVAFKSPSSQAIQIMRKYDPKFELHDFEKEVEAVFKQLMHAFFRDKLDDVKNIAGESALAVLTSEIKSRRERKIECKYKEFLYIDRADYTAANVIDEDNVVLRFRINCQEINCKISQKDGKVVEGEEDLVLNVHYMIDITRNPNPIIEEVGHPYMIVGLERIGVARQIL